MSKQKTSENPLKEISTMEKRRAKAAALRMMAETFPGTDAKEMYLRMSEEALKGNL